MNNRRQDFPVLQNTDVVYFDNACMTLRPEQVWKAMNRYYKEFPACPGRSHHKLSEKATEEMEKSREKVKDFLGARKKNEIIFTKNTTEAINLVANSLNFEKGDEILGSDREHNSNLVPWQRISKKTGAKHVVVESDSNHEFSMENFEDKLSDDTKLVSVVHTSNLDGYTLPVREIIGKAHERGALVLIDGAQSAPHKPINLKQMDADFFAMSGHKICGPSGIGCLYVKEEHYDKLDPFMVGGETVDNSWYDRSEYTQPPQRFEAGLPDVAGAIGFGKACEYVDNVGRENIEEHERKLNKIITEETQGLEKLNIVGVEDWRKRSGIFNFNLKGKDAHEVGMLLDESENIAIRTGMHCLHSWFNSHGIDGSARASLYFYNTEEEAKEFAQALRDVAKYLV